MIKNNVHIAITIIIVLLLIFGCRDLNRGIPEHANHKVPADSLINILYDIHIIDAIILSNIIDLGDLGVDTLIYDAVFEKYKYSQEEFENTLLYYTHYDLDSLAIIYSTVMDKLHQEKGEIMKL